MSQNTNQPASSKQLGSAFDLLGKSVNIVKKNWQAFAVVNILSILAAIGSAISPNDKTQPAWTYGGNGQISGFSAVDLSTFLGVSFVLALILVGVGIFLFTMATSLEVKSAAGQKPDLSELFNDGKKYFFRMIGVVILAGLIVLVGLVLLIIPGLIALGRLIMAPYHLVDKDSGVIESLKRSNKQAAGNMWPIYGAIGVTLLVSIVASILNTFPVVGPLAGVSITIAYSLILALRYQQLKGKSV